MERHTSHAYSAPVGHLRVPVSGLRSPFCIPAAAVLSLWACHRITRGFLPSCPPGILFHISPRKGRKSPHVCCRSGPRQIRGEKLIKTSNFCRVNRQSDKYRRYRQCKTTRRDGNLSYSVVSAVYYLVIRVSSSTPSLILPLKSRHPPKKKNYPYVAIFSRMAQPPGVFHLERGREGARRRLGLSVPTEHIYHFSLSKRRQGVF